MMGIIQKISLNSSRNQNVKAVETIASTNAMAKAIRRPILCVTRLKA